VVETALVVDVATKYSCNCTRNCIFKHHATVNGDARTNNMCEGWNNNFFNLVGHAHPSIWRVIEWCQKEEATVRTIIQQDAVGNPPAKRTQQRLVETDGLRFKTRRAA
jgi:hypothetical protein